MRFVNFRLDDRAGTALQNKDGSLVGRFADDPKYPGSIADLVVRGGDALASAARSLAGGPALEGGRIEYLPPFPTPPKIICLGLNYADHAAEGGFKPPSYPTIFARFASSLVGHGAPLIRPRVSTQFDYEGELVAVVGRGGRHISREAALDHICGYSIFNDASVRDFQMKTPQWTVGKNFDGTGAFGPAFVTADELPRGAAGLSLQTRLNGKVMQSASTTQMIFDVVTTVALITEALTLEAGDVLVMGTPSGIGMARTPQIFMKAGDVCEIEIEGLGILRNPIADEPAET
ncbi:MAG TPA: fumarylacetoacetate hydrolase family protein [Steroidobacteraceae bacterium]|nr:fumarylacetoacetate hydrolase family protein [Steroidobacteraceae bacterium]